MKFQYKTLLLLLCILAMFISNGKCQEFGKSQKSFDSIAFNKQLEILSIQKSQGYKISFSNIDTNKFISDIELTFAFPKRAIKDLISHLKSVDSTDKNSKSNILTGIHKKIIVTIKNAKFTWIPEYKSYLIIDTIPLLLINGINIKTLDKVIFEIVPNQIPVINAYLKTKNSTWFYFNFKNSFLSIISNSEEFNNIIKNRRIKIIKGKNGLNDYTFSITIEIKMKAFVKRIDDLNHSKIDTWPF